jgi:hypothetical protein
MRGNPEVCFMNLPCTHLAGRARPRAQQGPPALTRWIFINTPLALDVAAPEDGRAPLHTHRFMNRTTGV